MQVTAQPIATPHKWWILSALATTLALSFIDMTAVSVSLPQIQKLLHASNVQIQWVINAYLLALSVFIIMGGRLGDMHGHRRIFFLGATLFLLASIACATAPTIRFLIASRVLQGFSAALLTPSTSTIMLNTFSPAERGRATGIYVGSASVFLAIGPFLGGVLTEWASWRWIFWINVPLLIFAISIIRKFLQKDTILKKTGLDWWGVVVLTVAMSSLVFSMMQGNVYGWQSFIILALFIVSIVLLFVFYFIEKNAQFPLIDFSIFQIPVYLACLIAIFSLQMAMMTGVFRAIWLQNVLDYSPAIAGLLTLPGTIPILVMSPLGGRMVDKYGIKLPAILGLVLSIVGMFLTAFYMHYENYWLILPGIILLGIGAPLAVTPIMMTGMSSIPRTKRGMGAGMFHAGRQFGGTVGLAVLGAIITTINFHLLAEKINASPAEIKNAYTIAFVWASYAATFVLLIGLAAIAVIKNYKIVE